MTPPEPPLDHPGTVDFDVHGVLRVRVIGPRRADLQALSARLGPWVAPGGTAPDLTLRCDEGPGALRHVEARLSVAALARGMAPLHGSGIVWRERGVVVTGRAGGGKTGVVLAFMCQGATLVGDDWLACSADGGTMYGLPWTIDARPAYVAALPALTTRLTWVERARRGMLSRLQAAIANGGRTTQRGRGSSLRRRVAARLDRSLRLSLDPRAVFGEGRCPGVGKPHAVFFVEPHSEPTVSVRPITLDAAVRRAIRAMEDEWRHLPMTTSVRERRRQALHQSLRGALSGKRLYAVRQPHPPPPDMVFRALSPFVTDRAVLPVA